MGEVIQVKNVPNEVTGQQQKSMSVNIIKQNVLLNNDLAIDIYNKNSMTHHSSISKPLFLLKDGRFITDCNDNKDAENL